MTQPFFLCKKLKLLRYICMILMAPTDFNQNIRFIKRPFDTNASFVSQLIQIRDDISGEDIPNSVGTSTNGDYTVLTLSTTGLKEGRYYSLKVFDQPVGGGTNTCVYKDKIFVTGQSIDQTQNESYTINKNEYDSFDGTPANETSNNDYIVI